MVSYTEAVIGFESADVEVVEADGEAVLVISFLSPAQISSAVSIDLTLITADNTAIGEWSLVNKSTIAKTSSLLCTDGSDYDQLRQNLTLSGTVTQVMIPVNIINDDIQEIPPRENFTASLSVVASNVPYSLNPNTTYVTIIDDDGMCISVCVA